MTFLEFKKLAEAHLLAHTWRCTGNNGLWNMYVGFDQHLPLPGALAHQLRNTRDFYWIVDAYLLANSWKRLTRIGGSPGKGMPHFFRPNSHAHPVWKAVLIQLRIEILSAHSSPTVQIQL